MFEDFKEKIKEHTQNIEETKNPYDLSPEILENLKKEGIDPQNCTLNQLFPEMLDQGGSDLSLLSAVEWDTMVTYFSTRKYLLEKYPQSQQEAKTQGEPWREDLGGANQIDIVKARYDVKASIFYDAMPQMKTIYDKLSVLQAQATDFEKFCLRLYWHLSHNWNRARNFEAFRETFEDSDIFEIVDAYFKICKKYHQPTFEELYYFLSDEKRREIKLEGDMIKRTTTYSQNEIHVSILEAFG
jgi:hypothetical protein